MPRPKLGRCSIDWQDILVAKILPTCLLTLILLLGPGAARADGQLAMTTNGSPELCVAALRALLLNRSYWDFDPETANQAVENVSNLFVTGPGFRIIKWSRLTWGDFRQ